MSFNIFKNASLTCLFATCLSGCAFRASYHGPGTYSGLAVFDKYKGQLEGYGGVDNSVLPLNSGKSCIKNILGIAKFGSSGIVDAMHNGNITRVHSVQVEKSGIFTFFKRECVIVYGEKGSKDSQMAMKKARESENSDFLGIGYSASIS